MLFVVGTSILVTSQMAESWPRPFITSYIPSLLGFPSDQHCKSSKCCAPFDIRTHLGRQFFLFFFLNPHSCKSSNALSGTLPESVWCPQRVQLGATTGELLGWPLSVGRGRIGGNLDSFCQCPPAVGLLPQSCPLVSHAWKDVKPQGCPWMAPQDPASCQRLSPHEQQMSHQQSCDIPPNCNP